jgi:photosystem II stability/assembly factor-like uncharacterized protein
MLLASCGLPTGADAARPTVPVPTATPVQLNLTVYSHVTGLTMLSPTEGWAVGDNDVNHQSYLLHLRNGVWSKQTLADGKMEPLAIAMLSPTDGWIAGADHPGWDGQGAMLHLSGGQWTRVPLPAGVGPIESIAMVSPEEGWAVDASNANDGISANPRAHFLHYTQNNGWTVAQEMPQDTYSLQSVQMVSPNEGWAAGLNLGPQYVWHYAGGTWQRVALHDPQFAALQYVSMLSADEGWGIGRQGLPTQKTDQSPRWAGAIWHYSGGQWQVVQRVLPDTPGPLVLAAIQAVAPGDVWVSQAQGGPRPRFLHLVNGALQQVPAPIRDGIFSIAMTSPQEGWAIGAAGQILHYSNGEWADYPTCVPACLPHG